MIAIHREARPAKHLRLADAPFGDGLGAQRFERLHASRLVLRDTQAHDLEEGETAATRFVSETARGLVSGRGLSSITRDTEAPFVEGTEGDARRRLFLRAGRFKGGHRPRAGRILTLREALRDRGGIR